MKSFCKQGSDGIWYVARWDDTPNSRARVIEDAMAYCPGDVWLEFERFMYGDRVEDIEARLLGDIQRRS